VMDLEQFVAESVAQRLTEDNGWDPRRLWHLVVLRRSIISSYRATGLRELCMSTRPVFECLSRTCYETSSEITREVSQYMNASNSEGK